MHRGPSPRFTDRSLPFLRALKRNNNREWFRARRQVYDTCVRGPMVALIERLAEDFRHFAPELIASPKESLYRIYRDTRFTPDKSPLKTHVAAVFPCRHLPKHEGAGLYLHIATSEVLIGGGLYAPHTAQLYLVREHIATHFTQFRSIVEAPSFRRRFGAIVGETLQRVPHGFARDHRAAEYLKFQQFLASCEYPPTFATSPRFYSTVVTAFRHLSPFVRFLNEPLTRQERPRL